MSHEVNEDKLLDNLDENELLKHIENLRREAREPLTDGNNELPNEYFVIAELALVTYSSQRRLNRLTKVLIIFTGVLITFTAILVYFTILLASKPV